MIYTIVKVPIGGYCRQNEQCQESEISGVCEHRRCVCKAGYIQYNLECHEGKLEFFPKKNMVHSNKVGKQKKFSPYCCIYIQCLFYPYFSIENLQRLVSYEYISQIHAP